MSLLLTIMHCFQSITGGGSRLLKRGSTTRSVIIVDVGPAGICTLIVCEAHRQVKHANTREPS